MIDSYRYTRSIKARQLRGAAALTEMIERIGAPNSTYHDVAHILTDHELELRELLSFAMTELAKPETITAKELMDGLDKMITPPSPAPNVDDDIPF